MGGPKSRKTKLSFQKMVFFLLHPRSTDINKTTEHDVLEHQLPFHAALLMWWQVLYCLYVEWENEWGGCSVQAACSVVLGPAVRQTVVTASLEFRAALPLQPTTGYTQCLKCRAILRAQRAAGRVLIPEGVVHEGSFCLWVLLFLTGRESRNLDVRHVRSLALWPAKQPR